jgi:hypothetical protein
MTQNEPWQKRTRQPVVNSAQLEDAVDALKAISDMVTEATNRLGGEPRATLLRKFMELRGNIPELSNFLMLDIITPETVGPKEVAWFQKAEALLTHTMNALLGRPLNDPNPPTDALENVQEDDLLILLSRLNRAKDSINKAFPPRAQERAP